MPTQPSRDLVAIDNPHPQRDYEVECVCPEFTCVCPMTGQPDFATFTITYMPDARLVELRKPQALPVVVPTGAGLPRGRHEPGAPRPGAVRRAPGDDRRLALECARRDRDDGARKLPGVSIVN